MVDLQLLGTYGFKTLMLKMHYGHCSPRIPVYAHPILPPSSVLAVLCWNCSPVSVWGSGFTATLQQTSARRLAVISLTSLCLSVGNPPCEQLKACSTVKCFPQAQLPGRRISCHHSVGLVHPGMFLCEG